MKRPELLLVCLAGTMVSVDGQAMLCLRRSNPEDASTMLSVRQLQQRLHGAWNLAEQTVVVLDVGRNPWFRGGSVNLLRDLQRLEAESVSLGQRAAATGGMFWISTCSSGERSIVSEAKGRGVYLEALTMALEGAADGYGGILDGEISLQEIVHWTAMRTAPAAAAVTGTTQHCWHFGDLEGKLIIGIPAHMRTAPAESQGAFSENAFADLSGTRLEANRIVGDCIEQLRSGEMKRLLEAASGASKLDPGNRQAWRLQMLAHLSARNYGDALAALTQTGDELWLPVTESTVLIRLDDGGSVTVFGGDRIQLGQADKVGFVRVQGICTAGTEKVKSFEGLLTMSAVQRQKVDAADWVRSLASSLQLSPAVVCAFEEIHSQAERKNKLQRLFLNPAFRPN